MLGGVGEAGFGLDGTVALKFDVLVRKTDLRMYLRVPSLNIDLSTCIRISQVQRQDFDINV